MPTICATSSSPPLQPPPSPPPPTPLHFILHAPHQRRHRRGFCQPLFDQPRQQLETRCAVSSHWHGQHLFDKPAVPSGDKVAVHLRVWGEEEDLLVWGEGWRRKMPSGALTERGGEFSKQRRGGALGDSRCKRHERVGWEEAAANYASVRWTERKDGELERLFVVCISSL